MFFRPKTYQSPNTRRHKRMRANYLIKYKPHRFNNEPLLANLRDLSAGGAKFFTQQFFPEASVMDISIFIPPIDKIIEATGRIVRVRKFKDENYYYTAIRFVEIKKEDFEALNQFIETLSQSKTQKLIDHAEVVKRETELQPL